VRVIGGSGCLSIPGVAIDQVPWREDAEGKELAACHVGVMPLLDGAWERGKCGYKVIQWRPDGRRWRSAVGASNSIMVPGQTGFLAVSAQEWLAALEGLAADRERARAVGLASAQKRCTHCRSAPPSWSKPCVPPSQVGGPTIGSEELGQTRVPTHRSGRTDIDRLWRMG
jgi:hypothetical protein